MYLPNGTTLKGTYKIVRFIASGGFGCTYEAQHIMLGKRVAIKEFFIENFCNRDTRTSHVSVGVGNKKALVEKLRGKFIDEARSIAQMSHQNIVTVSDVFQENGTAYYVMDYIDGESLSQIVRKRGRLPEQEALCYIKDVASALKYVHSLNRLHLDIKPANIMVGRDGHVTLIDFGVSKQYDEINGENTSTLMGYSAGYAPVEQMGNRVKTFTPATDIYALGATFYTLLSGIMPPLDATDRADEDTLEPLPTVISTPIRNAIKKAMNVSRNGRIQSIDDFLNLMVDESTLVAGESPFPLNSPQKIQIKTFHANGISFDMVRVEAGTFMMGATSEQGSDAEDEEKPVHQVTLSSYYIGKYEVTQDLWQAVMGSNPSYFKGSRKPVECVSWNYCQTFISKLNSLTGERFRLPTEAEWEFAARGGNNSNHYKYSGSNTLDDVAWFGDNSGDTTHDVGMKSPNELGIYDMSGNVWEWCSDWYDSYNSNAQTNPTGPSSDSVRVNRGGSWGDDARECRSSCRRWYTPDGSFNFFGLRLVLVP